MQDYRFAVGFGYDVEEGKKFREEVEKDIQSQAGEKEVSLIQIGATIAVHTGPYAIGVGIIKQYEHFL